MKSVLGLPLNTAQGSNNAASMGRGWGNVVQSFKIFHAVLFSSVCDRHTKLMMGRLPSEGVS